MLPNRHDAAALGELIDLLAEAPSGNRKLDLRIEYCAGVALEGRVDAAELLIDDGFAWETVSEALQDRIPPYSSSLDAQLPGENIVLVIRSQRRDRWGAAHRTDTGQEFLVWGATEPIARRAAALTARRSALLEQVGEVGLEPDSGQDTVIEDREWKVMF